MKRIMPILLLSALFCFPLQIQAQKFLKKTLRTSDKYDQKKDGFEFKWYEYSYIQGNDKLYAAFDINGKRVTPNVKGYVPVYVCGGCFLIGTGSDAFSHTLHSMYNINGECIFTNISIVVYLGEGLFSIQTFNDYGEAMITVGNCFGDILFEYQRADDISFVDNYFIIERFDDHAYSVFSRDGLCIIPFRKNFLAVSIMPNFFLFHGYESYGSSDTAYSKDGRYFAPGFYSEKYKDEFDSKKKRTSWIITQKKQKDRVFSNNQQSKTETVDLGLLYKGDYTVSGLGSTEYPTISIYENQLCASILCFDYKSTNSKGERVYKGTEPFGAECTYYVSENYNIRLVKSYYNIYTSGYDNVTFSVTKGTSRMPAQQGGYAPAGDNEGYQWKEHGTTNNPVQPHQVTTSCSSCQGSGKCSTCNGKHWYYGIGGSKVTCPNCTPNGACSFCGGSGKKTTTKYY